MLVSLERIPTLTLLFPFFLHPFFISFFSFYMQVVDHDCNLKESAKTINLIVFLSYSEQ